MQISHQKINMIASVLNAAQKQIELIIGVKCTVSFTPETVWNLDVLLLEVCNILNVNVVKVKSNSRETDVLHARYILCYISKLVTTDRASTDEELGRLLGNRDRSTITNAMQQANNMVDTKHEAFVKKLNKVLSALTINIENEQPHEA